MNRVQNVRAKAIAVAKELKKAGKDDPRKIYHAIKVAIAVTLVSMLYYFRPLYDGFEANTVWAVMTVVVVFEFTVGSVLYKGINRCCATLFAGALGLGVQRLTMLFGDTGRPIVLTLFLFAFAASVTFLRFSPYLNARLDYGFVIFILTFAMVSVTGYRGQEILSYARTRFVTIALGVTLVMMISIFVFPAWAGDDLHKLIANNLAKLANYLEGFPGEYFQVGDEKKDCDAEVSKGDKAFLEACKSVLSSKPSQENLIVQVSEEEKEGCAKVSKGDNDKSFLQAYKSVLNTKSTEENLVNYCRWEPFHGRFKLRHPWKLYLEVGAQAREVAYQIDALNGYLSEGNLKMSKEFNAHIQEPCTKICSESSKALQALSSSMKEMTSAPSSVHLHMENAKAAVEELKMTLRDISGLTYNLDLLAIIPSASVASILIEMAGKVEKVVNSVEELARKAGFETEVLRKEKKEKSLLASLQCPIHPSDIVLNVNEMELGESLQATTKANVI